MTDSLTLNTLITRSKRVVFSACGNLEQILLGIGLSILISSPALAKLSLEEINSVARQTTVLIAPGLTDELVTELEANRHNPLASNNNPDGIWNPGSGVIISRDGNIYYVLTVSHNFKQRYLEQNIPYGIRTSDGQVHLVVDIDDGRQCPLQDELLIKNLIRLGCYSLNVPSRLVGTDLAIVSFESSNDYPIASLGNAEQTNIGETVYISGWPDPEKEKEPRTGKCRGQVTQRKRRLAWTPVTSKIVADKSENGYSLFYLDVTSPGMSGGPVFNGEGLVVGIHGRGSADKGNIVRQNCSYNPKLLNNLAFVANDLESIDYKQLDRPGVAYNPPKLHNQFSSGQNAGTILEIWHQLGLKPLFNFAPPTQQLIDSAFTQIVFDADTLPSNITQGSWDFVSREDIVGRVDLDSPQDVINDIYDLYLKLVQKLARIKAQQQALEDYHQNRLDGLRNLIEQMRPEWPNSNAPANTPTSP